MTIQHKTVLISGGGGGVGRAIAQTMAPAGIRVAFLGRDRQKLEDARNALGPFSDTAIVVPCDVTDRPQVKSAVETVLTEFQSIDILVCGAGINVTGRSLRSVDPADWDRIIATNLTGAFNLVHFVLPSMRERGNGLVIQLDSVSGKRANIVSGVSYSASKFGQAALGVCIAREERGRGIRSTVIFAGEVNTPFLDSRGARPGGGDDARRQNILQAQDIADVVRYLAELPPRVHIPEIVIKPTIDDFS
jgi:NADP-dependent 3-hydroxy acid dehydrogenase YdfG